MKKFLFSLLWACLLFQTTQAQENDLNEYLNTSVTTLNSETTSWEIIENIDDIDDIDDIDEYYDEEDYWDDNYYYNEDKDWNYHVEKDFDVPFDENDIGKFIGFWLGFIWILFLVRLIGFIFWIWMLVDAAKYQKHDRVGWILVLVFFNVLWALIYLFAAKIWRKEEDKLNY